MQGNDLSNEAQQRLLVHWTTVCDSRPEIRKRLFLPVTNHVLTPRLLDLAMISDLRDKWAMRCVLFGYLDDPVDVEDAMAEVEDHRSPFTSCLTFEDPMSLSSYLAMQSDIRYVVDRTNVGAFGSRTLHV